MDRPDGREDFVDPRARAHWPWPDRDGPNLVRLAQAGIHRQHKWLGSPPRQPAQYVSQVRRMDRVVKRAEDSQRVTIELPKTSPDQRTKRISRGPIGPDAHHDDRLGGPAARLHMQRYGCRHEFDR
jgi:hypothetical protein